MKHQSNEMKHQSNVSETKNDFDDDDGRLCHYRYDDQNENRILEQIVPEPDKELNDKMVDAFGDNTKQLQTLVVSGCGITDDGLLAIIINTPSLKFLDVCNTFVTYAGVLHAKTLRPDCNIQANCNSVQENISTNDR